MSREDEQEFTFRCPECDERLAVNGPMRETLIERGCVVCSASVTAGAFTPTSAQPSE